MRLPSSSLRLWACSIAIATSSVASADPASAPALQKVIASRVLTITESPFELDDSLSLLCGQPSYQDTASGRVLPLKNPHAKRKARVFANERGEKPLLEGAEDYPAGSVIVKAKYSDARATTIDVMTIMTKGTPGSNPGHGDWEYALANSSGEILEKGRLASCMHCHDSYHPGGNLARSYLKGKEGQEQSARQALEEQSKAMEGWWYSIAPFGETDLAKVDRNSPMVRFLWLRTFHKPVIVRAFLDKEGPKLRVVRLSGKGGYEWGKIDLDQTKALSKEEWQELTRMVRNPDTLRPLRTLPLDKRNPIFGSDGSEWILETVGPDSLSFARVWTPSEWKDKSFVKSRVGKEINMESFTRLCTHLLDLSGIRKEEIFFY